MKTGIEVNGDWGSDQMTTYAAFGRTRQKQRTRATLKAAAAELIEEGLSPTVEQVADAARVSRSTAYRYFSSSDALRAEVMLDTALGEGIAQIHAAAGRSPDAAERLAHVIREDHALVTGHETAFRTALQAFVVPAASQPGGQRPARPGNRLSYLAAAVEPLRDQLKAENLQRLVAALALCVGIESLVVTRDICHLSDAEAEQVKQWAAHALLQQALRDVGTEPEPRLT
jgi:AcrR family transcriptional regulator